MKFEKTIFRKNDANENKTWIDVQRSGRKRRLFGEKFLTDAQNRKAQIVAVPAEKKTKNEVKWGKTSRETSNWNERMNERTS